MTAWTSVRRCPLLRVVIAEKAQPRLRSAVPDGAATRGRAESRRSWGLCLVIALATLVLLAIGPGRVPPSDIFSGWAGSRS